MNNCLLTVMLILFLILMIVAFIRPCMPLTISVFVGFCFTFAACQHPSSGLAGKSDDVDHLILPGLYTATTPSQVSPPGLKIPLLLAIEWRGGQPTYRIMKDGSYIAEYKSNSTTSDYLTIIGTSRKIPALPFLVKDGHWVVVGKEVSWFWSGNENPEISTAWVSLMAPDGRTAHYKIIFGGKSRCLEKRLPVLSW